ncbi:hypothetical protein GGF46_001470 [Coemansia sp. RSA 552]|nr:hypothetical protein GGF46_001470 [Coemansia sp. RSA 552]
MVKVASTVLFTALFGMLASAQPVMMARDVVVATEYATVTGVPIAAVDPAPVDDDLVIVTETETVTLQPGEQAPQEEAAAAAGYTTQTVTAGQTTLSAAPTSTPSIPQAAPSTSQAVPSSTASAAEPSTTQAAQQPALLSAGGWRSEMLNSLNSIRAAAGKPAVSMDNRVNNIAQRHSQYQNSVSEMTHADSGGSLGTRYTREGINWDSAAENIAWNQKDVAEVMKAWKESPGHYANIVGDYDYVGFGDYNLYWTQNFLKA